MCFNGLFKDRKSGYSMKGFWGQIKHFNKEGVQIGYSVDNFFRSGKKRYDMNGKLVSYTLRNFWGGYNTYDANGNLIKRSRKNFFGGYNTYDKNGEKTHVSYENFWEGMNHYAVDDYPKNVVSYSGTQKVVPPSMVKKVEKTIKHEEKYTTTVKTFVQKETLSEKSVEKNFKYTLDEIPYEAPKIDKSVEYVSENEIYRKYTGNKEYAKLLVFSYKELTEFPAIAHLDGDNVKVEPLVSGGDPFEFVFSEIRSAKYEQVSGLEMNVVDKEFAAVCISSIGDDFEGLLPEYSWEYTGVSRVQYVFECGMIITEKSMEELRSRVVQ